MPDTAAPATADDTPLDVEALIAPEYERDTYTFDQLEPLYNFQKTTPRRAKLLIRMILHELRDRPSPTRVLDIGAGEGIAQSITYQRVVAQHCDELWGVEPDESIERTDNVFHNYQHALLETADLPESYFDVAYAFMVMEHVQDPDAFLSAMARCLKPGGVFIFMTPNKKHYFSILTSLLKTLRVEEFLLRVLRGKSEVEDYHYPVAYKCNTPKQIDPVATRLGLEQPRYVFLEGEGPRPYMRGPLILLFHLFVLKRKLWKNPRVLLTLVGRIRKPD